MTSLQLLLQQLINGLTLGAIYALIALGYTMIYGVIQLINFAHGEVFMVGAYAALTLLLVITASPVAGALPWWAMLVACGLGAMLVCGVLGLAIERMAYRPIRHAPRLNALITAIGMSFVLQNAVMLLYGATDRHVPALIPLVRWNLTGVTVTLMQVVVWMTSGLLMVGLHVLVMSTKLGMAMRATAQDLKACALPRQAFDVVSAMDVFEHLVDPVRAVDQLWEALQPGGFLYVRLGDQPDENRPQHIVQDFEPTFERMRVLGFVEVWRDEWLWGHQVFQKSEGTVR